MAKRARCALFAALALVGIGGPASADSFALPDAVSTFSCSGSDPATGEKIFDGRRSGPFGSCSAGTAHAILSEDPEFFFEASVDNEGAVPSAVATLSYFWVVTGPPVDFVPVDFYVNLHSTAAPADDPNAASTASAQLVIYKPDGTVDTALNICETHPVGCGFPNTFEGPLLLFVTPGAPLRVFMQLLAGSATGGATAMIDPHVVVDPSFPNADQYSIEFSPGISNAAPGGPVPEPATWATLLAGLGLAGAAMHRRRPDTQMCGRPE